MSIELLGDKYLVLRPSHTCNMELMKAISRLYRV